MSKKIEIGDFTYDRLKDLLKQYKSYFDTVDDLAEYILDK
jgi:hypothetical protein